MDLLKDKYSYVGSVKSMIGRNTDELTIHKSMQENLRELLNTREMRIVLARILLLAESLDSVTALSPNAELGQFLERRGKAEGVITAFSAIVEIAYNDEEDDRLGGTE